MISARGGGDGGEKQNDRQQQSEFHKYLEYNILHLIEQVAQ